MNSPGSSAVRAGRIKASPRARRAMKQLGIDPHSFHGSGPGGRIVEADVRALAAAGEVREPSKRRRAIARLTAASAATVPHFYLRAEIDTTALYSTRHELYRQAIQEKWEAKPSVTDLFLLALARSLRDCPFANVVWQNDRLVILPAAAVGNVVALDDGVLIPVIDAADRLTVAEMAGRRTALAAAARDGKLPADALRPAATSLNNLGNTRADEFQPILAPPQSSMLAVGRIAKRPFVVEGRLAVVPTCRLTLAVDHRVLDGAPAARFFSKIVEYLEHPRLLIA